MKINVQNYDILIKENINIAAEIKDVYQYKELFIVTDDHLLTLYETELRSSLSAFNLHFVSVKPGELSKSLTAYGQVVEKLIELGMRKNHLLIAFGGGVVGDLAGFVAATIFRGVDFIQIPTSLLAMVDSSVGGKTGIDLALGKNLVGAFKNPLKVLVDTRFLKTLPAVEYKNGLAEVLKAGLIGNPSLFNYLKTHDKLTTKEIIDAILVKVNIVKIDPFEKNERMFLNFGHTFGHAIERHYDYAIKHGVAISYGMLIALQLGMDEKLTKPNLYDETKKILLRLELIKEPLLDKKIFLPYIGYDKKNLADGLRFVFVKDLGEPIIKKGVKL